MTSPALRWALPALWFGLLVALVVASWWTRPGYVWLLDSVWGPHQPISWAHPDAGLGWQIVAHGLTWVFSAPIAEKLVLTSLLWAIGLGGYYLARRLVTPLWAIAAGTLYLANPFVYERLLGGQWIVLAGYAALPVAVALAWETLESRGRRGAWRWALLLAFMPLISPHFAYMNAFLTAALVLVYIALRRPVWLWSRRTAVWAAAAGLAALAVNWFWLASSSGRVYQAFTTLDFATYRTAADPVVGVWGNVLGLYGFWRGTAFIEPKDLLGGVWMAIALIILASATAGAVRAVRTRQPLALTLALAAPVAAVIAAGYAVPALRPLIDLLIRYLPGFRGLRDTAKLVGVLALAYAVLAPYGAAWLVPHLPRRRLTVPIAAAAVMLLALLNTTGLAGGAGRQVPVAGYPSGWYTVANRLARTPGDAAVVLPWHSYVSLTFAGNAYVAQPAGVFFANPIISSDEVDSILAARPDTPTDRLMLAATTGQISARAWAAGLRHLGARYVILEKTDDWATYNPLVITAGLRPIYQDSAIALYQL